MSSNKRVIDVLCGELDVLNIVSDRFDSTLEHIEANRVPRRQSNIGVSQKGPRKNGRLIGMVALFSALLVVTVAAASLGSFDSLKEKFILFS